MPPYMNPINEFYMNKAQSYGQMMLPFPPQQQTPVIPRVNCRFVTNIDEAKAAMIDPSSYNLFLDTGTGKIYLKKISNNGQAEFLCYSTEEAVPKDPVQEINSRLTKIENVLGGIINGKSVSNDAGVQQSAAVSQSAVTKPNEPNDETEPTGFPKNAGNGWRKK